MWIVTNNGRVETTFGNGPGTNQQWEIAVPWNHCVVPLESPNIMDHHGALLLARRLGRNRDPQVIIWMISGYPLFRKPPHNVDYHASKLGNCSGKPISNSFQLLEEQNTHLVCHKNMTAIDCHEFFITICDCQPASVKNI
jgi:hypothetical protein